MTHAHVMWCGSSLAEVHNSGACSTVTDLPRPRYMTWTHVPSWRVFFDLVARSEPMLRYDGSSLAEGHNLSVCSTMSSLIEVHDSAHVPPWRIFLALGTRLGCMIYRDASSLDELDNSDHEIISVAVSAAYIERDSSRGGDEIEDKKKKRRQERRESRETDGGSSPPGEGEGREVSRIIPRRPPERLVRVLLLQGRRLPHLVLSCRLRHCPLLSLSSLVDDGGKHDMDGRDETIPFWYMRTVRSSSSHCHPRICPMIRLLHDPTVRCVDTVLVTMHHERIVVSETTTPTSPQIPLAVGWAASLDGWFRFTSSDARTWRPVSGECRWLPTVAAVLRADPANSFVSHQSGDALQQR
ncbi:hypothetical protein GW17_00057246 [Ensete ventricosum]|nr:hypothetical protein GW17_00057246 [Ensete ventricosum]